MKAAKLSSETLRKMTVEIAAAAGHHLTRRPGSQLIFELPDGRTVRLRTSNDRCLTTHASSADMDQARLDIDGADYLLFGVPETKRGTNTVEAYLIPMPVAVSAVIDSHKAWLASGGQSKGTNTTPAIWLDRALPTSDLFSQKWAGYRLGWLSIAHQQVTPAME